MAPGRVLNRPSRTYRAMVALMSMMSISTWGPSRLLSGRMSRRAEGARPTRSSTRCQYSGREVYWSQATTAHLS